MSPSVTRTRRPRRVQTNALQPNHDPSNPYDETSPVPGEERYTVDNPHPLLGMMDPPKSWFDKTPFPSLRDINGNIIYDRGGRAIRNFHGWPRYISSTVTGDIIERLFRTNCQVTYRDVWARQPNWVPPLNRSSTNILNNHRARQGREPYKARCWSPMYDNRTPPKKLVALAEWYSEEQIAQNTNFHVDEEGISYSDRSKLFKPGYFLENDVPHEISPVVRRAKEVAKVWQKIADENGKQHWSQLPDDMLPRGFTFTSDGWIAEIGNGKRAKKNTRSTKKRRAENIDSDDSEIDDEEVKRTSRKRRRTDNSASRDFSTADTEVESTSRKRRSNDIIDNGDTVTVDTEVERASRQRKGTVAIESEPGEAENHIPEYNESLGSMTVSLYDPEVVGVPWLKEQGFLVQNEESFGCGETGCHQSTSRMALSQSSFTPCEDGYSQYHQNAPSPNYYAEDERNLESTESEDHQSAASMPLPPASFNPWQDGYNEHLYNAASSSFYPELPIDPEIDATSGTSNSPYFQQNNQGHEITQYLDPQGSPNSLLDRD